MKYLGLHKILWFILVTIYTLIEGFFILIYWLLYVIWNLRFPGEGWYDGFYTQSYYDVDLKKEFIKVPYKDKNIFGTIKRRYKYFFK